jgi:hypothetical protein
MTFSDVRDFLDRHAKYKESLHFFSTNSFFGLLKAECVESRWQVLFQERETEKLLAEFSTEEEAAEYYLDHALTDRGIWGETALPLDYFVMKWGLPNFPDSLK